ASCDVLTSVTRASSTRRQSFEPTLVVGTYTITQEQRLTLGVAGYVIGVLQGTRPTVGTLIGMGGRSYHVRLDDAYGRLDPIIRDLRAWTSMTPADVPPVVLNK